MQAAITFTNYPLAQEPLRGKIACVITTKDSDVWEQALEAVVGTFYIGMPEYDETDDNRVFFKEGMSLNGERYVYDSETDQITEKGN